MYKELYEKMINELSSEFKKTSENETDISVKLAKMNDILNLIRVLENYDELEPVIAKFLNEKARKRKFYREK